MKVKGESEKVGLKLNIQKTKIMASGPITSWQIDGVTVEIVADFILLGSKITGDGDCSHEIKRCLLLGRQIMTNLDSILKSRDIPLPTKVHLVSSVQFSCSVESDSLWLHELQHARPPCPWPTPSVYPNSCPLSRWCHPTFSSCRPLLLLPSVFPSIRVFSNESALRIRWPKYWSFSFKAMVFPVVMYGCESWTIKTAERWRMDAFDLWY